MSANAITLADITSADWSLKLGTIGQVVQGVADVGQCVAIILTTPLGSDPLRPTFGCDLWRFIDRPISIAVPHIVREVSEAINQWEPRAKLISVSVAPGTSSQAIAQRVVTINWQLQLAGAVAPVQSISIPFAGGAA